MFMNLPKPLKEASEQARVWTECAVTDADTDSIDSDIDKARDTFY